MLPPSIRARFQGRPTERSGRVTSKAVRRGSPAVDRGPAGVGVKLSPGGATGPINFGRPTLTWQAVFLKSQLPDAP